MKKGISLVALVITIIVLLILAGVALAALTGDSGILNNTESAKIKTNLANAQEQVKLAMKLFFSLDSDFYIGGLTPGDFANVQKKADFMKITDEKEITKMLQQEVNLKKDKNLQRSIGF